MATPIDVVVFQHCEIFPTGKRWNLALFTAQKTIKFRLPLKLSLLHGSRPKSARASSQHLAHSVPKFHRNRFTFGGVMLNAWRPFFWPIEYLQYSPESFRANKKMLLVHIFEAIWKYSRDLMFLNHSIDVLSRHTVWCTQSDINTLPATGAFKGSWTIALFQSYEKIVN